ncbi:hypothetical protein [Mycobacterium sp. 050134]|uniref:hypothetical protein n=1 Tax=Mycobacterium sp. 050134 TaxID=3096111 RepID=UPI002EDB3BC8
MAVVQPCPQDMAACGPPHWIGPITDNAAAAALRDCLERGQWENTPLPRPLNGHQLWAGGFSRRN